MKTAPRPGKAEGMDRQRVLAGIDAAFGHVPRPEPMLTNPNHCCECAEHEETLKSVTPDTISMKEVGSPAWDPLCHVSAEAFQYFMPGLARLALRSGEDYYLDQFLFHLETRQTDAFTLAQCRVTLDLLWFAFETLQKDIDATVWDDCALSGVIDKLEKRLMNEERG